MELNSLEIEKTKYKNINSDFELNYKVLLELCLEIAKKEQKNHSNQNGYKPPNPNPNPNQNSVDFHYERNDFHYELDDHNYERNQPSNDHQKDDSDDSKKQLEKLVKIIEKSEKILKCQLDGNQDFIDLSKAEGGLMEALVWCEYYSNRVSESIMSEHDSKVSKDDDIKREIVNLLEECKSSEKRIHEIKRRKENQKLLFLMQDIQSKATHILDHVPCRQKCQKINLLI